MLFHVDIIYLAKQAKRDVDKKLCFEMRTVTKSKPGWDFFSYMSKRRKHANVLPVLAQNKRILCNYDVHNSSYPSFWRKKTTNQVLWRNDAKVFRRSSAFAVVVTSRSSSFEYTMLVHAEHAGAERNVCIIVVSTETHQTTTNPAQTLLPMYKLAHLPLPHSKSSPQRPPQPLAQPFAQMRYRCKYLNCISFIYMYICVRTWDFVTYRMCLDLD